MHYKLHKILGSDATSSREPIAKSNKRQIQGRGGPRGGPRGRPNGPDGSKEVQVNVLCP